MKRILCKLHPCLRPLFCNCFLVYLHVDLVVMWSRKLMNLLLTLRCLSFASRMILSTLSYASLRSTKSRWVSFFLLLLISGMVFNRKMLSLHVREDLKPFCSGLIMSSLKTAFCQLDY